MAKFINRKSLKVLEYDKILLQVANYTSSQLAKNTVLSIKPSIQLEEAEHLLNLTGQAIEILYEHLASPSFSLDEMESILDSAQRHMTLSCGDIIKVGRLLRTARLAFSTIDKINSDSIQDIKDIANLFFYDNELESNIYSSILSDNEVSDNASSALKSIRQSIKACNEKIRQKLNSYVTSASYSSYLQDSLITMRNNRYVIPVKSEYVKQVSGLVHDQSSSGSTVYIEPMAVVEMNNQLRGLCAEESNEIERILQYFSQKINICCENLRDTYERLAYLDSIFAKARYAQEIRGNYVQLNKDGYVDIILGRHPLIDKQKVVPVSISIGNGYNTLMITGPNTGGKTVCLKLVGILSLMAASGIFPPCSADSKLAVFDNIFCDIGDEQNIEQSLSTFSSHMTNLIYICDHVTPNCLLLLDELGVGTDPTEGSALAISLIEYFKNKGCKTVTSTHYSELKEYSLVTDGVVSAGMDFDPLTFAPTYKLIMGQSSSSNALEIASALGLKKHIIQSARGRLSKEKIAFDNVIRGAERSRRLAKEYEDKAKQNYEKTLESTHMAEIALEEVNEQKRKLEEKLKKGAKELLYDYLEEADELIENIKECVRKGDESALFEARKLRKKLADMTVEEQKPVKKIIPEKGKIQVGDRVFISSLNNDGEVLSINEKKGECQVKVGILTTNIKLSACQKIVDNREKQDAKVTVVKEFSNKAFSFELNLIGQRVDEALFNLDAYLSEAVLHNCNEVRIVHGKGTGILRKAVHEYLSSSPIIAEFRLGKYGEGETGVTIATLK